MPSYLRFLLFDCKMTMELNEFNILNCLQINIYPEIVEIEITVI